MSFETVIQNAKEEVQSKDTDEDADEETELEKSLQILVERDNPMADSAEQALDLL